MDENTTTVKKKGRRPKLTTKVAAELAVENRGGVRAGAGEKPKYKRIDVSEELEAVNFKLIHEYLKLYAKAVEDEDKKLQKEILDTLIRYAASPFGPTAPDQSGSPTDILQGLITELVSKIPRPPEPQGSTPKDDE